MDLLTENILFLKQLTHPPEDITDADFLTFLSKIDRVRTNGNELPSTDLLVLFPAITDLVITKFNSTSIYLPPLPLLKSLNLSHGSLSELPDLTSFKLESLDLRQTKLTQIDANLLPKSLKYMNSDLQVWKLKSVFDRNIRVFVDLFSEVYYEEKAEEDVGCHSGCQAQFDLLNERISSLEAQNQKMQFQIDLLTQMVRK